MYHKLLTKTYDYEKIFTFNFNLPIGNGRLICICSHLFVHFH